jgi:hypothetical protein
MVIGRPQLGLLVLAVFASGLVAGCNKGSGDQPDPNAGKTLAQRQEEQIKQIQDNPKMPDAAKQVAIEAVKAHAHPGGMK